MQDKIVDLKKHFNEELRGSTNSQKLEQLKVKYLGKKGPIQELMKFIKDVPPEQRPEVGKWINDLKQEITVLIETKFSSILEKEDSEKLIKEKIDISLPGRRRFLGRKHVVAQALDEIIDIFISMGFSVQYGPDIDSDYYNFEALNFAPDHPARDMQDTFYISENMLLRTHTSNIQARVMESNKPPIRIIAPGKVYRNETITSRSHVFFHQVEGFYVNENVTFKDLVSTMDDFLLRLFKKEVKTRYRPSYFPFVEPGLEIDIECISCGGSGCQLCKYTGWLEFTGAGMIHPEVLRNGGIDPEIYSGYAWGMGVERLTQLKYGIKDIRLFWENDQRFLKQFA